MKLLWIRCSWEPQVLIHVFLACTRCGTGRFVLFLNFIIQYFPAIFAFFPSDFRGNTLHHYGYMYAHLLCSMFSVDFVFVLSGIVVGIEEYTGDLGDKRTVRYALRHSIHSPLKQTRCITYENDLSVVTTSHDSTFSINQHNAKFWLTVFVYFVYTSENRWYNNTQYNDKK